MVTYTGTISFTPNFDPVIKPDNVRRYYGSGCCYLGSWGTEKTENALLDLYYQPDPPKPEYSNYFMFRYWGAEMYIQNGLNFANTSITNACIDRNGKVIVSKTVHDFVQSSCGSFWLDGGPCYSKVSGDIDWVNNNRVLICFDKDEINVVDPSNGLILTSWKEEVTP